MAKFTRPDWLGETPHSDFREYGDWPEGDVWYSFTRPDYTLSDSCFATHTLALRGNERCLEIMRLYYLALTTHRLKT